jgi:hypothetical protein
MSEIASRAFDVLVVQPAAIAPAIRLTMGPPVLCAMSIDGLRALVKMLRAEIALVGSRALPRTAS